MTKIITRRDFMKGTATAAVAAGIGVRFRKKKSARVVLIRNKDVIEGNRKFNPEIIQEMLDQAMMKLTNENDPKKAFSHFVTSSDVVGIKSNAWRYIPTPDEVEDAIKKRLTDNGVKAANIGVDDRGVRRSSLFQKATVFINVRPVRTHYWSGIGGCIKNPIMFDSSPSRYHPDSCADLAELWKLPIIKDKIKLNILCAFTPLFHGRGPHHYDRNFVWNYNGLLVSADPVAIDAVGLEIIKAKRLQHFGKEEQFETVPKHIKVADEKHGLGVSDLNKIELIKLGWKEGILI